MEIIKLDLQAILLIVFPTILVFVFVFLFRNLGTKRKSIKELNSYSLRYNILSKAEANFYNVLKRAIDDNYLVFPKIRLADVFFTKNGQGYYSALNKITAKHIDFLLCDPQTFSPIIAIELDDKSHEKQSRKTRDQFVDQLFYSQDLPLLRIKVSKTYHVDEIHENITESIRLKQD